MPCPLARATAPFCSVLTETLFLTTVALLALQGAWTAQDITNFLGLYINSVVAILISHLDADHAKYLPNIGFNVTTVSSIIIGGQVNQYNPDVRNWFNTFPSGVVKVIQGGVGCIDNCTLPAGTNLNFCTDNYPV